MWLKLVMAYLIDAQITLSLQTSLSAVKVLVRVMLLKPVLVTALFVPGITLEEPAKPVVPLKDLVIYPKFAQELVLIVITISNVTTL